MTLSKGDIAIMRYHLAHGSNQTTQPYTIPSDPHAINMRRLGNLLWRMYMEVPLNDEYAALLGDIIETVGMQLAGGELYTSEVREAYEEINRHNASLDAPPPPAIPDDTFIPSNDAAEVCSCCGKDYAFCPCSIYRDGVCETHMKSEAQ